VPRILFATDYPYRPGPDGGVEHFLQSAGLDRADQERIVAGNWDALVADIRRWAPRGDPAIIFGALSTDGIRRYSTTLWPGAAADDHWRPERTSRPGYDCGRAGNGCDLLED
jgi:hypothetical protein